MRIMNLYAGIGGNRTHWEDCEVTAVELNPTIADFYAKRFPMDTVIVGDAHQYLLDNFKRFDFIWSSIPCQTHSRSRFWGHGKADPVFPDMKLWQEILFLQHYSTVDWVVENVVPYYEPLIEPTARFGRHLFWSSRRLIGTAGGTDLDIRDGKRCEYEAALGIKLGDHKFDQRTDQILRNCVHPQTGLDVFKMAQGFEKHQQPTLFD